MIKKISITGGIGSGKSTVVKMLASLGYCVWDADVFVANAMKTSEVEEKIKNLLGNEAYLSTGILNREWVRTRVFLDTKLKNGLEDILHPVIQKVFAQRLQHIEAQDVSCWIFYEASLIFEKKRHTSFDANILVIADEKKRLQRVRKNKKLSPDLITQIMSQQMSDREKKKLADHVIDNSGNQKELEKNVLKLVQFLKKKFEEV